MNMVAQYQERRDVRAYLEILLSLATISIFAIFALRPTLLTIAELTQDIDSKEETIQQLDSKIESLVTAENVFAEQRRNVDLLNQAVPNKPSPDELLIQIQGAAARYPSLTITGFAVDSVVLIGNHPQQASLSEGIPENALSLTFSINAKSQYLVLADFLSDLESMLRPVHFDSISFTSNDNQIDEGEILLVIGSRTPYVK